MFKSALFLILLITNISSSENLEYVIELCRHGARSPVEFMQWDNTEKMASRSWAINIVWDEATLFTWK